MFPIPSSGAVQVIILVALGVFLTSDPASAEHMVKVYRGKRAGGGSVTERILVISGDDYEVLNITVEFKNGSTLSATRSLDLNDSILLCATGRPMSFYPHIIDSITYNSMMRSAYAINCVIIDPQTGLASNFSCQSHSELPGGTGGKPPGVAETDTTDCTTDGVTFSLVESELSPWAYGTWMDSYHFNGTSLVKNSSYAITLNAKQLRIQHGIRGAFTKSWSAVSFLSSGVLEHGPRGLYVTDGKGGSANLTDAAGVPLDALGLANPAQSKGSFAVISSPTFVNALVLLVSSGHCPPSLRFEHCDERDTQSWADHRLKLELLTENSWS